MGSNITAPYLPFERSLYAEPPDPLLRQVIDQPFTLGVRAIDGLLTCGIGQRIGIFAGSGVGKSTLLGMICNGASADIIVLALIGERGREVNESSRFYLNPRFLNVYWSSQRQTVPRWKE
ncbi:translocator EscN [Escherichia coli]|uniref:protein-secreting ATPase n=1 Tax=Escherichia coli TaxID=562 RepID=A0A2X3K172_ECOLX|nr:translocator EscN [Escherichia coli]